MAFGKSDNLYSRCVLSVQELKKLFPPVFYQNEEQLSTNLTATLLVEKLDLVDGQFTGEMAFWLKMLSTPTDPEIQLQKIQFKRNVYKAYRHFVEPQLSNTQVVRQMTKPSGSKAVTIRVTPAAPEEANDGEGPFVRPTTIFERKKHPEEVVEGKTFAQPLMDNNSAMTEAEWAVIEACLNETETTSTVVTTPLTPKQRTPRTRAPNSTFKPHVYQKVINDSKLVNIYKCNVCDVTASSSSELRDHKYSEHPDVLKFKCSHEKCDYRCKNSWTLKDHVRSAHSDEKNFKCDKCNFSAKTNTVLIRHRNDVHLNKRRSCDKCTFTCKFSEVQRMRRHQHLAHNVAYKYKCEICTFSADTKIILVDHINTKHAQSVQYFCPDCPYSTYSNQHIKLHRSSCTRNPERKLNPKAMGKYSGRGKTGYGARLPKDRVIISWCSECGQTFSMNVYAEKHAKEAHLPAEATVVPTNATKPGTLTFKCSECDVSSCMKYDIDRHLSSEHDGKAMLVAEFIEDENYVPTLIKCRQCDFTASNWAGMNSHIRSKHERIIRKCELCSFKSFHKNGVSNHMILAHGTARKGPKKHSKKNKESVAMATVGSSFGTDIVAQAAAGAGVEVGAYVEEVEASEAETAVIPSPMEHEMEEVVVEESVITEEVVQELMTIANE